MTRRPLLAVAGIAVLAVGVTGAGPTSAGGSGDMDAALTRARLGTGAPAASASVAVCGRVVWSGASGVTDLDSRRRVSPATRFVVASVSKTVTATMIMQQVRRGRLSLRTRLSRFYPAIPHARDITMSMLLRHRSGLAEYSDDERIAARIDERPRHRWTRNELIRAMRPAQFRPGTRFRYTNSNYVVLGGVLEQVARTTVERTFRSGVAAPARMRSSTWTYDPAETSRYAHPHQQDTDGGRRSLLVRGALANDTWGPVWTDGGLTSTATDLSRFADALFRGRLLPPSTVRRMSSVGRQNYGIGLYARRAGGHRWLGHDGSYGGYEAEAWTDVDRNLTVAVTVNMEEHDAADVSASETVWRAVARAAETARLGRSRCPAT